MKSFWVGLMTVNGWYVGHKTHPQLELSGSAGVPGLGAVGATRCVSPWAWPNGHLKPGGKSRKMDENFGILDYLYDRYINSDYLYDSGYLLDIYQIRYLGFTLFCETPNWIGIHLQLDRDLSYLCIYL